MKFLPNTATVFILLSAAANSFAHVTLEQQQAEAGSTYKAVLRVGHGCEGMPTQAIRVQIPDGFEGAHPMPKAGWTLKTSIAKLAKSYDNHGKTITEDVREITWSANSPDNRLADAHYDEFIFRGRLGMPAGAVWFKVEQICQDGSQLASNPWTEIPAQGTSMQGLRYPAALLNVNAPKAADAAAATAHKH